MDYYNRRPVGAMSRVELDGVIAASTGKFNVKNYGAIGDGITDDAPAIQAAINAGDIFFPPGTYWTNGAVVLTSAHNGRSITGYGATLTKNSGSSSYVVFAGLSNGATGYGSGPSNLTMHGLIFRGKFGDATRRTVCAMSLHHSENVLVYNCQFIEAAGGGHRFDLQGCRGITIRDNVFKGFDTYYAELYAEDIQADFSARGGASYAEPILTSYDTLPCLNILVENNKWLPLTIGGTTYPAGNPFGSHGTMVGQYGENFTFRGNYIESPVNDTQAFVPGTLHFIAVRNLIIENNIFVGNGNTNPAIKVYRAISGGTAETAQQVSSTNVTITPPQVFSNVRITGNIISGYTGGNDCVRLDGDVAAHATIAIVENNIFTNNSPDNGATNSGPLTVNITYTDNVSFRGNKVTGSRRVCVISDGTNIVVAQNTGINIGGNDITVATSAQVTISGNTITNNKSYGIYVDTCTDATITGNTLENRIYAAIGPLLRVSTPVRAIVTGNVLKGLAATSNKGIEFSGAFTSSLIANNIAIGFTLPINPTTTGSGATITGNIIT